MQDNLDYSIGAKPLYAQLYDILLNQLENGNYTKNDRFPTEAEFQKMFGVSRITARRALEDLAKNGYIKRMRGIGSQVIRNTASASINITTTFLADNIFTDNIFTDNTLTDNKQPQHLNSIVDEQIVRETLQIKKVTATPALEKIFELAPDVDNKEETSLFFIRRLLKYKHQIVQLHDIYLSHLITEIDHQLLDQSLYLFLEKSGCHIDRYTDYITAVLPNETEANILQTTLLEPLLMRTRIGYNTKGIAIEYSTTKFISRHLEYKVELR